MALEEGVATRGDGRRLAHRVLHPVEQVDGTTSWRTEADRWVGSAEPKDGPGHTWTIVLHGQPERLHGVPVLLSPNGASVVAQTGVGEVHGVIDYGTQAYAFTCAGDDADATVVGWCLGFMARTYVETWEG